MKYTIQIIRAFVANFRFLPMFGVVCDYVETNPNRSEAEFTESKSAIRNPNSFTFA
jgi:hypothetical protein